MKQVISIQGKSGRIAAILQRPYLAAGAHCPLVILMHGFMANSRLQPIKGLAEALERGMGKSIGLHFIPVTLLELP